MMQSAISRGESIGVLLQYFYDGKGKSMARYRTFSTRYPSMPKFSALLWLTNQFKGV